MFCFFLVRQGLHTHPNRHKKREKLCTSDDLFSLSYADSGAFASFDAPNDLKPPSGAFVSGTTWLTYKPKSAQKKKEKLRTNLFSFSLCRFKCMQALTHDKKMLNLRLTHVVFIKQRSVSVCASVAADHSSGRWIVAVGSKVCQEDWKTQNPSDVVVTWIPLRLNWFGQTCPRRLWAVWLQGFLIPYPSITLRSSFWGRKKEGLGFIDAELGNLISFYSWRIAPPEGRRRRCLSGNQRLVCWEDSVILIEQSLQLLGVEQPTTLWAKLVIGLQCLHRWLCLSNQCLCLDIINLQLDWAVGPIIARQKYVVLVAVIEVWTPLICMRVHGAYWSTTPLAICVGFLRSSCWRIINRLTVLLPIIYYTHNKKNKGKAFGFAYSARCGLKFWV